MNKYEIVYDRWNPSKNKWVRAKGKITHSNANLREKSIKTLLRKQGHDAGQIIEWKLV